MSTDNQQPPGQTTSQQAKANDPSPKKPKTRKPRTKNATKKNASSSSAHPTYMMMALEGISKKQSFWKKCSASINSTIYKIKLWSWNIPNWNV